MISDVLGIQLSRYDNSAVTIQSCGVMKNLASNHVCLGLDAQTYKAFILIKRVTGYPK